ncbi:Hypothetical_protein [Hexamita inflata]|uniref:Hypothetical_protein n=1 Tax=Hexamita inflata TaxID=28002 RepID=A0ABP1HAT4_9EUKA
MQLGQIGCGRQNPQIQSAELASSRIRMAKGMPSTSLQDWKAVTALLFPQKCRWYIFRLYIIIHWTVKIYRSSEFNILNTQYICNNRTIIYFMDSICTLILLQHHENNILFIALQTRYRLSQNLLNQIHHRWRDPQMALKIII